jgi:hypothetical protein
LVSHCGKKTFRISENMMLRRIFGPKRKEMAGGHCIMRSFITCTLHQVLLLSRQINDEMGGACSTYGRDEKCIQYFSLKT